MSARRAYRAGESIEDYCRACKTDRLHTVIVVGEGGIPLRVSCGYCESQHNYRGGPRVEAQTASVSRPSGPGPSDPGPSYGGGPPRQVQTPRDPLPIVSERERTAAPVALSNMSTEDLERLLRRIIREEAGITPVAPAQKWRGGTFVLRPGTPGLQEKSWPIETFFHKVVMLRNRLRTLEQQVNASDLPDDVKVKLQGYVSGCYGSLTSFNVLFADENDQFKGSGE
ncbi:MAG: hypothetical protein EHM89_17180 [Acidobacteria bacterium]|nr:MAG: hypothetical protein EHM89_17180 [Acidobacteriota bacterium]